jgi:hypothetical protein
LSIEVKKKDQEPMFKVASAPVVNSFAAFEKAVIKNPPVVSKPVKKKDLPKAVPKYLSELFKVAMVHDKVTGCEKHANANRPCVEGTIAQYLGLGLKLTHDEVIKELKNRGVTLVPDYFTLKCGHCKNDGKPFKFSGEMNFIDHMLDNHSNTYTLTTLMDMIGTLEKNTVTPGRQIDIKIDPKGNPLHTEHQQDD